MRDCCIAVLPCYKKSHDHCERAYCKKEPEDKESGKIIAVIMRTGKDALWSAHIYTSLVIRLDGYVVTEIALVSNGMRCSLRGSMRPALRLLTLLHATG